MFLFWIVWLNSSVGSSCVHTKERNVFSSNANWMVLGDFIEWFWFRNAHSACCSDFFSISIPNLVPKNFCTILYLFEIALHMPCFWAFWLGQPECTFSSQGASYSEALLLSLPMAHLLHAAALLSLLLDKAICRSCVLMGCQTACWWGCECIVILLVIYWWMHWMASQLSSFHLCATFLIERITYWRSGFL